MSANMFAGLDVEEGEDTPVKDTPTPSSEKKKKRKKKKRSGKTREEIRKDEASETDLEKENEEAKQQGGAAMQALDEAELMPLSEEQYRKVEELRASIMADKSLPLDDGHIKVWLADTQPFKRFLLARDFNMEASRKMLVDCINWRHEYKPWKITVQEIEQPLRGGHMYSPCYDRQGHACVYMRQHTEPDPTPDDVAMKFMMWSFESAMYKMMRASERKRYKMVWFVSNAGYNPKYNRSMKFIKELAYNVQNYYPERMHRCYFFYAPTIFRMFFNVLKAFIDKNTRSKFVFVHGSNAQIEQFLGEFFDLGVVEDHFFGKVPSDDWDEEAYVKECYALEKEMNEYFAARLEELNNPGGAAKGKAAAEAGEEGKKKKKSSGKNKRKKQKGAEAQE